MLRVFDKENFLPHPDAKESTKLKPSKMNETLQSCQKDLSAQVTSEQINLQVFEKQLKKITDCLENQRKENWNITQTRNRLQNQAKVLRVENQSLLSENEKLRTELTNLISRMKDIQTKNSTQLTDFYYLKNQHSALLIQLRKLEDSDRAWSQKWQQLTQINIELESSFNRLQSQEIVWKNQCKLRDAEIEFLRSSLAELELENKKSVASSGTWISEEKFNQIGKQLQNWKHAFQKKQQELESKAAVLQEQNNMMRKTLDELSNQTAAKHSSLQKSCSLPTQINDKYNEYQVRLFVKQNQIEKMTEKIKQLEEKNDILELENALLSKKCTEGTVFSPAGYQRYNQVQNTILKKSNLRKEAADLKMEMESKEKEIQCLVERLSEAKKQMESITFQSKKLESEIEYERITYQNVVGELKSSKTKLEKEVESLKLKLTTARNECAEKDKIILNYIGKSSL